MRTKGTGQRQRELAFKEAAFTSRMAEEARMRARDAWKAGRAMDLHPDYLRGLEVQARVAHARASAAAEAEDAAWDNYRATLPHG